MKMLIVALATAAALAGCGKSGNTQAHVSDGYGEGEVKLVMLQDGTRCAVLIGYSKGGIHCDWKH